ncbi:SNF2 family DNA-dependent ATPase, partial [Schizophyllum commune]
DDPADADPAPSLDPVMEERLRNLELLLKKANAYTTILQQSIAPPAPPTPPPAKKAKRKPAAKKGRGKRTKAEASEDEENEAPVKKRKTGEGDAEEDEKPVFSARAPIAQPKLITGATMKDYQLEGLRWMVGLDSNGVSGILADEMGLGKTLQTIAFNAYIRELKHSKHFLIVCPLSVLHNWVAEFEKFAPDIPVCMYHGTVDERAELRRTMMAPIGKMQKPKKEPAPKGKKSKVKGGKKGASSKKSAQSTKSSKSSRAKPKARRSGRLNRAMDVDEEEEEEEESSESEADDEEADPDFVVHKDDDEDDKKKKRGVGQVDRLQKTLGIDTSKLSAEDEFEDDGDDASAFPVVVTTYEMIIRDAAHLADYDWGYIIVDEGHRLKNIDCKLMREIKRYNTAHRMILTGTPLHNNLSELWSLLNFVLPDIFQDLESFQEWFNIPYIQETLGTERSSKIINDLHALLKPFLLRRLKSDVETNLPPKKEYVLYAPLSRQQRETYDHIVNGTLRAYLIGKEKEGKEKKLTEAELNAPRQLRVKGKMQGRYTVDGDDDEYFENLENGMLDGRGLKKIEPKEKTAAELGEEFQKQALAKKYRNLSLQNTVMQLRKVCSHPFLFDWPLDSETHMPVIDESLVHASGKMMVLERLLDELFRRKHKVLLFSQFTKMLDIIEDWAVEFKGWNLCRIDGQTPPLERRAEMDRFQTGGDAPDAPCLFLLSTRAGGLGINLTAADTVIFYDQDWNPQMDAQAQDRAHRIGQTRPVLIFRLVSAHTIETKIMQRATEKRKLEALVIAKGRFKAPTAAARAATMAEMASALLQLEGEKINVVADTKEDRESVLSDADLNKLLDRSPEVFAGRQKGWTSATGTGKEDGSAPAFAVYDAPGVESANEALTNLFGEQVEE